MKITFTGNHRTGRNARAKAAERLEERRSDADRRSGAHAEADEDRREGSRRDGDRRTDDVTSFSREIERRLIKMVEDPVQNELLRRGKLTCPVCGGPLKTRLPARYASRVIWEVRCRDCSRCMIHRTT